jgi:uncharacterized membrane protein YeaQ/YmgE (transglycosylase-associated protein family)
MIGMNFAAFLTLLILGFIAAIVIHSAVRYRMLEGVDGFLLKWVAGWIGAWLGSPVLGHWWFQSQNVYIVPALVGAFVGAFTCVALIKANAQSTAEVMLMKAKVPAMAPDMIRKAS